MLIRFVSCTSEYLSKFRYLAIVKRQSFLTTEGSILLEIKTPLISTLVRQKFRITSRYINEYFMFILQDVIRHWINLGVDGILIKNAAFLAENKLKTGSDWYNTVLSSQIYVPESLNVIRNFRSWIQEASGASVKPK